MRSSQTRLGLSSVKCCTKYLALPLTVKSCPLRSFLYAFYLTHANRLTVTSQSIHSSAIGIIKTKSNYKQSISHYCLFVHRPPLHIPVANHTYLTPKHTMPASPAKILAQALELSPELGQSFQHAFKQFKTNISNFDESIMKNKALYNRYLQIELEELRQNWHDALENDGSVSALELFSIVKDFDVIPSRGLFKAMTEEAMNIAAGDGVGSEAVEVLMELAMLCVIS